MPIEINKNLHDDTKKGFSKEVADWWVGHSEYEMALVKHFIEADDESSINKFVVGGSFKNIVFPGYISWIKSFLSEPLSQGLPEDKIQNFQNLCESLELDHKYSQDQERLVNKLLEQLENKGVAYMHYSSHDKSHANIFKLTKESLDKYYFTIFNAGAFIEDAKGRQKDLATHYNTLQTNQTYKKGSMHPIFSTEELKSKVADKIRKEFNQEFDKLDSEEQNEIFDLLIKTTKLPQLDNNAQIIFPSIKYPINKNIKEQIKNFLEQSRSDGANQKFFDEHKDVKPIHENEILVVSEQKTGTCSVRSVSEAIRDAIGTENFLTFHNYIKSSQVPQTLYNDSKIELHAKEDIINHAINIFKKDKNISEDICILPESILNIKVNNELVQDLLINQINPEFLSKTIARILSTSELKNASYSKLEYDEFNEIITRIPKILLQIDMDDISLFNGSLIKNIDKKLNQIEFINGERMNITEDPDNFSKLVIANSFKNIHEIRCKPLELKQVKSKLIKSKLIELSNQTLEIPYSLNIPDYDEGFNKPTKQLLLKNLGAKFATDNNLDKKLSIKLMERMFKESIEDNNFPITKTMLTPVMNNLEIVIGHYKKKLTNLNIDNILDDWRVKCLTNNLRDRSEIHEDLIKLEDRINTNRKIDLYTVLMNFEKACITHIEDFKNDTKIGFKDNFILKAPILKGLIDDHKEEFEKLSKTKLLKDYNLEYYHDKLFSSQKLSNEIYLMFKDKEVSLKNSFESNKKLIKEKIKFNKQNNISSSLNR